MLLDRNDIWVDSEGALGHTPLSWAILNEHEEVVRLILETGKADVNRQCMSGETPLRKAARGPEAVVRLLLKTGEAEHR